MILANYLRDQLMNGLVAFEIRVTRIEGKYKLGQNRSNDDIDRVYVILQKSEDEDGRKLAELMKSEQMISTSKL